MTKGRPPLKPAKSLDQTAPEGCGSPILPSLNTADSGDDSCALKSTMALISWAKSALARKPSQLALAGSTLRSSLRFMERDTKPIFNSFGSEAKRAARSRHPCGLPRRKAGQGG